MTNDINANYQKVKNEVLKKHFNSQMIEFKKRTNLLLKS